MLPRTSPTKATSGVALISASPPSPAEGGRPTAGSDEGNSSKDMTRINTQITCPNEPVTRAHECWGSSTRLTVWLMDLDIVVLQGRDFADLSTAQLRFDPWRQAYNQVRPHETLDLGRTSEPVSCQLAFVSRRGGGNDV